MFEGCGLFTVVRELQRAPSASTARAPLVYKQVVGVDLSVSTPRMCAFGCIAWKATVLEARGKHHVFYTRVQCTVLSYTMLVTCVGADCAYTR